jgi:hypothetical protein
MFTFTSIRINIYLPIRIIRAQGEIESPPLTVKTLCLNHLTIEPLIIIYLVFSLFYNKKPSASIALTSSDYKTGALLLC